MESGFFDEFGGIQKRVERRGVVDLNDRIGQSASAKGGGMPEIRRTWHCIKAKREGRWIRRGVQQRSRPIAVDCRDTGRYDDDGTFGEPPLPLSGGR